ncbi:MAG: glycosyl hydrolase 115 family protein [Bacteroidales bacterium]|nr:glycosyl hydrolase 115 family protein [Bacteroidales bacterium]
MFQTKHFLALSFLLSSITLSKAIDLSKATIVYNASDEPLVAQMANIMADDIERVSGLRPKVSTHKGKGENIILATSKKSSRHKDLHGKWERYAIDTQKNTLFITGSDARGLAYGVLHVSEQIGVSPWYWWADVPIKKNLERVCNYEENFVSNVPSVKYRGIFINDEDWGLKTWASNNFEKELGDIGPKTYDKVCELILRLHGNMLAPAMHTCTGAFYSHPESQVMADKWGIMITTSHCEPLLFNNAAPSEWNKERDGEWNYETNRETILGKLENRIRETAQYDNIYTMGMRGLHDEAMKGSTNPADRARTLEKVFAEQRAILSKYKGTKANGIKQIFVPYKETLDIYDAGLRVPDDITLVWPDDNYGYMKRVSNDAEQKRQGGSGVYYHLSYLGTPHDNLWIATTAPMLMYEELKKAYSAGANRYWLLNVGDIKPMEIETQMFFDMAFNFDAFSYDNANLYQAQWLSQIFGHEHLEQFQYMLDQHYRLAWDRKPEFMGYEIQWDTRQNERLLDSDFSFQTGTAQKRLFDYENLSFAYKQLEQQIDEEYRPALFEMLGYALLSAHQMNRKFLYAQANHETGELSYAQQARDAYNQIEALRQRYNSQLNGKWNDMISEIPPGFVSQYQRMPDLVTEPTDKYRLPKEQLHPEFENKVDLCTLAETAEKSKHFRLLKGIGTDWIALQMGQPLDSEAAESFDIMLNSDLISPQSDSVSICLSVLPMWPVATDKSNRLAISIDGCQPVVCENKFIEWSYEWKLQVLENRKEFVVRLPLDKSKTQHKLTLSIVDPGQIVQKITYTCCP